MRKSILVAVLLAVLLPAHANPNRFEKIDAWQYAEPELPAEPAPTETEQAVLQVVVSEPTTARGFKDLSVYYVREGDHLRREICEHPPLLPWAAQPK
jgi:hypothetical protein